MVNSFPAPFTHCDSYPHINAMSSTDNDVMMNDSNDSSDSKSAMEHSIIENDNSESLIYLQCIKLPNMRYAALPPNDINDTHEPMRQYILNALTREKMSDLVETVWKVLVAIRWNPNRFTNPENKAENKSRLIAALKEPSINLNLFDEIVTKLEADSVARTSISIAAALMKGASPAASTGTWSWLCTYRKQYLICRCRCAR
jgi:hypothetical protein